VAVMILLLGYYIYNCGGNEVKHREKVDSDIHFFQLQQLRYMAADELSGRLRISNPACAEYKVLKTQESAKDAKPTPVSKGCSIFTGVKVGVCFFGGYYLSAAWICEMVGIVITAGIMLTPWGMAIEGGIAILLAIYCAYDHYKANQSANLIEFEKTKITNKVAAKRDECQQLLGVDSQKQRFFKPQEQESPVHSEKMIVAKVHA
jgi:hypothetical protein